MATKIISFEHTKTESFANESDTQGEVMSNSVEESVSDANTVGMTDNSEKYVYKAPDKRTIIYTMILSFFVPAIIMALALYNTEIYPGGTNTLLIYDMKSQFLPIYASMRYLGHSQHSVLYTFFGALGNNALPNYSTYLINPLSWITVLFSLEQLPDVIYYLTIFRIGLGGLGFSTYLFFGKKENRERRYPLAVFLLSCCYALMSFSIMYSLCMNWLDIVALLPIMLLGIERIVEGKRGAIFVLTLAYALLNSFQLSYMSGIFLTMYLVYRLVEEKCREWIRIVVRFSIDSICALGLTMPIFLPMLISMMGGRSSSDVAVVDKGIYTYYPLWDVLKQLLSCRYDTIENGGLPYLFCGTISIILVLLYFLRMKQNVWSKMVALLIIAFYFASFCIIPLNKVWHGFMEPYCFPGRYSFTLSCFFLILAYDFVPTLYKKLCVPHGIGIIMGIFISVIVLVEQYMNSAYIIASHNVALNYKSVNEYNSYVVEMQNLLCRIDDDDFYRIGRGDSYYSVNDGMIFGYNGMDYFSSFYNRNFMDFLGTLGYSQSEHVFYDMGATPLSESLLGVKYRISKPSYEPKYSEICNSQTMSLYYNENALPLGYIMGKGESITQGEMIYVDELNMGNAFLYQEIVLEEALGEHCDVYQSIKYDLSDIDDQYARHVIVDFIAEDDKPVWIFFRTPTKDELDNNEADEGIEVGGSTFLNGESITHIRTDLSTICVCLGQFRKGEGVQLEAYDSKYFGDPWIVYYDEEACNEALKKISSQGFVTTSCNNGVIKGTITVDGDDSYALFTLPYMDGYRIKVDGELTGYKDYRSVLLMIPLNEGKHTIEISFIPPGLKIGIIICAISMAVTIIVLSIPRHRPKIMAQIL